MNKNFNTIYKKIIEAEEIFKASTPEEGERRLHKYRQMAIKDFKERPEWERTFQDFIRLVSDLDKDIINLPNMCSNKFREMLWKFMEDYLSGKYIWMAKKYDRVEFEEDRLQDIEIPKLMKDGWKIYYEVDLSQTYFRYHTYILYKEAPK